MAKYYIVAVSNEDYKELIGSEIKLRYSKDIYCGFWLHSYTIAIDTHISDTIGTSTLVAAEDLVYEMPKLGKVMIEKKEE